MSAPKSAQDLMLQALPDLVLITRLRTTNRTESELVPERTSAAFVPGFTSRFTTSRPYLNQASVYVDLIQLQTRLERLEAAEWPSDLVNAICSFLNVLEGKLICLNKPNKWTFFLRRRSHHYPNVNRWIEEGRRLSGAANKPAWLDQTTAAYRDTSSSAFARLCASVQACEKCLPPEPLRPLKLDLEQLPRVTPNPQTWSKIQTYCADMETLHRQLTEKGAWNCSCDHGQYLFEVDFRKTAMPGFVASSVIQVYHNSSQRSKVEFRCYSGDGGRAQYPKLCEDLPSGSRRTHWYSVKGSRRCPKPVPSCQLPGNRHPSLVDRLYLALKLSHLYLHLSGGEWWPYERTGPYDEVVPGTRKSVISFFENVDIKNNPPLFRFGTSTDDIADGVLLLINETMPTLPLLGKMLLEICTWQTCTLKTFNARLGSLRDDWAAPYCDHLLHAIRTCIGGKAISSGRIRTDADLKKRFTENVIHRIQHVLEHGFKKSEESIFAVVDDNEPDAPTVSGTDSLVPGSDDAHDTSSHPGNADVSDSARRAPRVAFAKDATRATETVRNDDIGGTEQVDKQSIKKSAAFMEELKPFQKLLEGTRSEKPVKVVILDTGINLSPKLSGRFRKGRYKSYSWLGVPDDGENRHPLQQDGDSDGHGTHMASIVLDIAQHCDLYAVQIAANRNDVHNQDASDRVAADIARAIRYAVDEWDADIISMSCGFLHIDEHIQDAIVYAYAKPTLIIAATGNSGAARPLWPSSDNNVMGIYAADGYGNKYGGNHTGSRFDPRLSILGCAVAGYQGADGKKVHRSGTSHATAVATGVAAISMQILRNCQAEFSQYKDKTDDWRKYELAVKALKRKPGMERLFSEMTEGYEQSGGYHFVRPWTVVPDTGSSKATQLAHNIVAWCHGVS